MLGAICILSRNLSYCIEAVYTYCEIKNWDRKSKCHTNRTLAFSVMQKYRSTSKQKCLAVARHPLYIKRTWLYQMRIENRINQRNERSSCISSNKGCRDPRAYNILANAKRLMVRSTKHIVFSKMFHLFSRDLSVKWKEIFVSVNWTLLLLYFGCPYIKLSISTKNALLQQDTAYIKRFV